MNKWIKDLLRWYHIVALIGWLFLGLFFINMSMTDYSTGSIQYKGFIPSPWEMFFPIVWMILEFIYVGAMIEAGIQSIKNDNDKKEKQ